MLDASQRGEAGTTDFGVRGLVRAFGRRLVAVERHEGVQLPARAAERGPALATSRQSGESGDKSPHSPALSFAREFSWLSYGAKSNHGLDCAGATSR
jgi:hypothetical protein